MMLSSTPLPAPYSPHSTRLVGMCGENTRHVCKVCNQGMASQLQGLDCVDHFLCLLTHTGSAKCCGSSLSSTDEPFPHGTCSPWQKLWGWGSWGNFIHSKSGMSPGGFPGGRELQADF